ncbi:MFS transporter [Phytohabitans houttuyneae]|uniref:MFS transporter n=1 Tax=Phytohabitans houttuyneae TaxID=1076126 RepID=A0A6V8KC81_9ACTN|nr:MFS transporter [Phytohabitans houttuyneae]GFJ82842.1 MFS transporter [Phytohabitans houttuyneae]
MTTTAAAPAQEQRKLPRPFWALWAGTLVNRLGTMVMPFTGVYLTQARGFSVAVAGLAMTLFGVGSLISQLVAGLLTDRIGRRVTLSGSMVATAAVMLALGYSSGLATILAGMFVLGLLIDAYRPASSALVADLVAPSLRPKAFGLLFWAINLGYAVAMVAGGWLAHLGFSWLFFADAVTCVVFAALVWRAVPETRPLHDETATGGFGAVLRDRTMVAFTVITFGQALVYLQTVTMLPVAMTDVAGLDTREFGMAMALNGILIVAFQPLVSGWLGRYDLPRVMALGLAVMAAGFAATAYATTAAHLALTVALWTTGEIITAGIGGTIVAALAPAHLRGGTRGCSASRGRSRPWSRRWPAAGCSR